MNEDIDGTISLQSRSSGLFVLAAAEWHNGENASRPIGPRGPSDGWHPLTEHCAWDTGIVTFLGSDAQKSVDSAVVLGLSLQRFAKEFPRIGIAISSLTQKQKVALAKSGWQVLVVDNSTGLNPEFHIFRVCMRRVLYVDPDLAVLRQDFVDILGQEDAPPPGHIAMASDNCERSRRPRHAMLFKPSLAVFDRIAAAAQRFYTSGRTLRELAANEVYKGKVTELDGVYLASLGPTSESCQPAPCGKLALASFTGLTDLDAGSEAFHAFDCPQLRRDHFCRMKQQSRYLSPGLRKSLTKLGNCSRMSPGLRKSLTLGL